MLTALGLSFSNDTITDQNAFAGISNLNGILLPESVVNSSDVLTETKLGGLMTLLDMQKESNRMDFLDKNALIGLTDLEKVCLVYNSISYEYSATSSPLDNTCSANADCHVFLFDKC